MHVHYRKTIKRNKREKNKREKKSLSWCISFQSFSVHMHTLGPYYTYYHFFFCKGPDSKCFWLCRPYGLCQLCHCSGKRNEWGSVPIKLHLQKQAAGFRFSLLTRSLLLNNLQCIINNCRGFYYTNPLLLGIWSSIPLGCFHPLCIPTII